MIALILAPIKGEPPYPPLSICALKSWLLKYNIESKAIDLNKRLYLSNLTLANKIKHYFGQPQNYIENDTLNSFYNLDTIYNFQLLLKLLYPQHYTDIELDDSTSLFCEELNEQLESDSKYLVESGFKFIGFSTFVSNICYSILLAEKLKKLDNQIKIFFGGCSTAYEPIREFLINSKIVDYVLVGEGENPILRLCQDLKNNSVSYHTIYSENLAPKNLKDKEITAPIIKNLDDLPFADFTDLDLNNYTPKDKKSCRFLSIATSRGCVNRCAYCSETQYWSRFRQRSVLSVINEIEHAIQVYKTKIFFFCDSLINGNNKWIIDFCKELIDRKLNIQWLSYATINNLGPDLLKIMKESGCISLTLGVEHISSKVLKDVNKTSSIVDTKTVLLNCVEEGIFPLANIIYSLPNEHGSDFLELLYFVTDPDLINTVRFTFRPYEIRVGSIVTEKLMEQGESFISHNINYLQLDESIQNSVQKLSVYWSPSKEYINETKCKFNVLNNIIEHQEKLFSLKVSNLRNYNFSSVLNRLVDLKSIPQLRENEKLKSNGFQNYLISLIDGKNTVDSIVNQTIDFIRNEKPSYQKEDIYNISFDFVKKNLIDLSIKQVIAWKE